MFNPDSITQDDLHDLRQAAELAWGEDVRHPSFRGHPDQSKGSCFITSKWLQSRLGGHVGIKDGHFFWVSPDKKYVIDLTGDLYSYDPIGDREGELLDEFDSPWVADNRHRSHRPGPVVYTSSHHPVYRDFRLLDDDKDDNPRAQTFRKRADAYMHGGMPKQADLLGPTPYTGETPQKDEDWQMDGPAPMIHDEPNHLDDSDQEYKFIVTGKGTVDISPVSSHEELLRQNGLTPNFMGPLAIGYADVEGNNVVWSVTSNISLTKLHKILSDFSDNMGWEFGGMTNDEGNPIADDFGPKMSMWYAPRYDGHLIMSSSPLPRGRRIEIIGKTAHCPTEVGPIRSALREWAEDFGYRLEYSQGRALRKRAEYPGGGQMQDRMEPYPYLDQHNLGDPDLELKLDDIPAIEGPIACPTCGKMLDSMNALISHDKAEHFPDMEEVEQNQFPWPQDPDQPLGFGTNPYPAESGGTQGAA